MFIKNKKYIFYKISILILILFLNLREAKGSFGELTTLHEIYSKCDYSIKPCSSSDDSDKICTIDLEFNRNFESNNLGKWTNNYKNHLPKIKINKNKLVSIVYSVTNNCGIDPTYYYNDITKQSHVFPYLISQGYFDTSTVKKSNSIYDNENNLIIVYSEYKVNPYYYPQYNSDFRKIEKKIIKYSSNNNHIWTKTFQYSPNVWTSNGKQYGQWEEFDSIVNSLFVDSKNNLYVAINDLKVNSDKKLFKINGKNGEIIWQKELRSSSQPYKNEYLRSSSRVLGMDNYDNLIFYGYIKNYEYKFIANISNEDGNIIWEKYVESDHESEYFPADYYYQPNNDYFRIDYNNNMYIFDVQLSKNKIIKIDTNGVEMCYIDINNIIIDNVVFHQDNFIFITEGKIFKYNSNCQQIFSISYPELVTDKLDYENSQVLSDFNNNIVLVLNSDSKFLGEKVGNLHEGISYWDIGIIIFSGYDGSIIKKKNIGSLLKEKLLEARIVDKELVVIAKSNDWSPKLKWNEEHLYPQVHFKKFIVDIDYDFTHPVTTTTPSPSPVNLTPVITPSPVNLTPVISPSSVNLTPVISPSPFFEMTPSSKDYSKNNSPSPSFENNLVEDKTSKEDKDNVIVIKKEKDNNNLIIILLISALVIVIIIVLILIFKSSMSITNILCCNNLDFKNNLKQDERTPEIVYPSAPCLDLTIPGV